jgi:hypothetical protein
MSSSTASPGPPLGRSARCAISVLALLAIGAGAVFAQPISIASVVRCQTAIEQRANRLQLERLKRLLSVADRFYDCALQAELGRGEAPRCRVESEEAAQGQLRKLAEIELVERDRIRQFCALVPVDQVLSRVDGLGFAQCTGTGAASSLDGVIDCIRSRVAVGAAAMISTLKPRTCALIAGTGVPGRDLGCP